MISNMSVSRVKMEHDGMVFIPRQKMVGIEDIRVMDRF